MKRDGRRGENGIEWRGKDDGSERASAQGREVEGERMRQRAAVRRRGEARARANAARLRSRSHDRARNFRPKSFTPAGWLAQVA